MRRRPPGSNPHRIHDDEPDTGEHVVRALLAAECPQWADAPLTYLETSGTDNAMWRVHNHSLSSDSLSSDSLSSDSPSSGQDVVVRLPRRPDAVAKIAYEAAVLERLGGSPVTALVSVPTVRHRGRPQPAFPHHWSVLGWLDGADAWTAKPSVGPAPVEARLAEDLASVVAAISRVDPGTEFVTRVEGERGGPLHPLLDRLDRWLSDPQWNAEALIDLAAVRRLCDQAREVADDPVPTGPVHGDLIPGNLLVSSHGRLSAVIDWGGAGIGDRAQDLAPAWSVLSAPGRRRFRRALDAELGLDDGAWIRARVIELEHAVGGVLYYRPRGHQLGDVMAATLERILTDR